jgi:hypothetical protein
VLLQACRVCWWEGRFGVLWWCDVSITPSSARHTPCSSRQQQAAAGSSRQQQAAAGSSRQQQAAAPAAHRLACVHDVQRPVRAHHGCLHAVHLPLQQPPAMIPEQRVGAVHPAAVAGLEGHVWVHLLADVQVADGVGQRHVYQICSGAAGVG